MKDFYKEMIMRLSANIADREALAGNNSGEVAKEHMNKADDMRQERANYEEALGRIE
tara:strand:- start:168 stop:338 length:171 start_codon:yes stop_codon:yes gene_type:complete